MKQSSVPEAELHSSSSGPAEASARAATRLLSAVRAAARQAASLARPVLAWTAVRVAVEDPIAVFGRGVVLGGNPLLWARPADVRSLVGIGSAWEATAEGPDRFAQVKSAWQSLVADAAGDAGALGEAGGAAAPGWPAGPVAMAGFSFASFFSERTMWHGFPAALLVLPQVTVAALGDVARAVLSVVVAPGRHAVEQAEHAARRASILLERLLGDAAAAQDAAAPRAPRHRAEVRCETSPSPADWKDLVGRAAQAVRRGDLTKVVVARSIRVTDGSPDPVRTLVRLRDGYPTCTLFAVTRGPRCFLGATPERLAAVDGRRVAAMALAGSAPRGASPEEDRLFGDALLAGQKDRAEHAVVVDALRAALTVTCTAVSVPGAPALLKLPNVQHLHTPITATLGEGRTILDLVNGLHPTPAVGGVPSARALEWLRQHEGLDRGWYAGPVGWTDVRGNGDFAVAIRSALLADREAVLFSGCGIMADSDPEAEYEESQLKLRPMLAALGGGGAEEEGTSP